MQDDDIASIMMAGLVSSNLKEVDKSMTSISSSGPANKINPRAFIQGQQNMVDTERQKIQDEINRKALELCPMPSSTIQSVRVPNSNRVNTVEHQNVITRVVEDKSMAKIAEASIILAKAFDKICSTIKEYIEVVHLGKTSPFAVKTTIAKKKIPDIVSE